MLHRVSLGTVDAAQALADDERARAFAGAAGELLAAAETVRSLGGEALTQLEVATGEGSIFVVRDSGRTIAATTSAEPTVGLVFYDLKSCLRSAADEQAAAEEPRAEPKPTRKRAAKKAGDEAASKGDET